MTPEGAVQNTILDWLAAKHILAFRMNTGAVKTDKRFFRFGVPGMADVLAFTKERIETACNGTIEGVVPVWIECKAPSGRQSELQKSFQQQVEAEGHIYIVARCLEDVMAVME